MRILFHFASFKFKEWFSSWICTQSRYKADNDSGDAFLSCHLCYNYNQIAINEAERGGKRGLKVTKWWMRRWHCFDTSESMIMRRRLQAGVRKVMLAEFKRVFVKHGLQIWWVRHNHIISYRCGVSYLVVIQTYTADRIYGQICSMLQMES